MSDKKIILLGYSGHGIALLDVAFENNLKIIGYADKVESIINPIQLQYLGDENDNDFEGWKINTDYLIGIGDNLLRERAFRFINQKGKKVLTLISNSSTISKHSQLGEGIFINRNVSINAFASIGDNVLLNTGCIIEHECIISDSVHVAPGATLAGNVFVGERTFIGANAVIKQGVRIGKDVVIGAGTVVLKNISDGRIIVGNPSRFI